MRQVDLARFLLNHGPMNTRELRFALGFDAYHVSEFDTPLRSLHKYGFVDKTLVGGMNTWSLTADGLKWLENQL